MSEGEGGIKEEEDEEEEEVVRRTAGSAGNVLSRLRRRSGEAMVLLL